MIFISLFASSRLRQREAKDCASKRLHLFVEEKGEEKKSDSRGARIMRDFDRTRA